MLCTYMSSSIQESPSATNIYEFRFGAPFTVGNYYTYFKLRNQAQSNINNLLEITEKSCRRGIEENVGFCILMIHLNHEIILPPKFSLVDNIINISIEDCVWSSPILLKVSSRQKTFE